MSTVYLVLECLLKALVVRETGNEALFIHDLERLALLADIPLTQTQRKLLSEANSFNLRARYADYRMEFYKRAKFRYTKKYYDESNVMRLWLLERLQNELQKNTQKNS